MKSSLISAGGKSLKISDMVFMGSYTIPVNQLYLTFKETQSIDPTSGLFIHHKTPK